MNAASTATLINDLLNTLREAARRLDNGADPDDVSEFLTFSADSYASTLTESAA